MSLRGCLRISAQPTGQTASWSLYPTQADSGQTDLQFPSVQRGVAGLGTDGELRGRGREGGVVEVMGAGRPGSVFWRGGGGV